MHIAGMRERSTAGGGALDAIAAFRPALGALGVGHKWFASLVLLLLATCMFSRLGFEPSKKMVGFRFEASHTCLAAHLLAGQCLTELKLGMRTVQGGMCQWNPH